MKPTRHSSEGITLPAGTYFIGDPCYVLGHRWEEVLDLHWAPGDCNTGHCAPVYELDGRKVTEFHTRWGDGGYYDQFGDAEYGVDSGAIGAVPIELCVEGIPHNLGRVAVFDAPFTCSSNGSILKFGEYWIDTDPDEEPEWGWDEEDEDEEVYA